VANQSFLFQQKSLLSAAIMFPETTEKKTFIHLASCHLLGGKYLI